MMRVLPDILKIGLQHLRQQAELQALVGSNIYVRTPAKVTPPFVQLALIGGRPVRDGWIDDMLLQYACYATTEPEASTIARTVTATFLELLNAPKQPLGLVVANVTVASAPFSAPDSEYPTPHERYIGSVNVTYHP